MLFSWSLLLASSAIFHHVVAHVTEEYIQQQIDQRANALSNFLQNVGPLGMPACLEDEVKEAHKYGKNYRIIVAVAHLCEPVLEGESPIGYGALASRLDRMRKAVSDLFSKDSASLTPPEKIAKGIMAKLSGSSNLEEQKEWAHKMTRKLRPVPGSAGTLLSAGKKSGKPFDLYSPPRKWKTRKTGSFYARNTDTSVSYWQGSGSQNHFDFFPGPLGNDPGTHYCRTETGAPSYCPQRVLDQVQSFSMSNLRPDSAGQVLRPTALRPNPGRARSTDNNRQELNEYTPRQSDYNLNHNLGNERSFKRRRLDKGSRFTVASIFGDNVQGPSEEERQDTQT